MALNLDALSRIIDVLDRGFRGTREEREKREQAEDRVDRMSKPDKLRIAMEGERKVDMIYTRKDGVTRNYIAHPYSRRGSVIYATEARHGHDQIHSFRMSRIGALDVRTTQSFDPRWDTEPESV